MPTFTWNDHQIHYRQQGTGDLLLLLPGNTASSILHQGELGYFSRRYHTVSIDFLGTGKSERIDTWPDDWWLQAANQSTALVEHLGYRTCIAMGTSGGAAIALLMAIHYPDLVQAVIADSCTERFTREMFEYNVIQDRDKRTPEQVHFWQFAHGDDWEQVIEADTGMLQRFTEHGGDWFDGRLSEIRCPVLLTASLQDRMLPNAVQQASNLAAQIDGSCVFINKSGSHPLMWSSPDDFRGICNQFLQSIAT